MLCQSSQSFLVIQSSLVIPIIPSRSQSSKSFLVVLVIINVGGNLSEKLPPSDINPFKFRGIYADEV